MLLPQVAEIDIVDQRGIETDDINTIVEYIDQVVFDNEDDTPEDEDTDDGQNFHLVKQVDIKFFQQFDDAERPVITLSSTEYTGFTLAHIESPYLDTITPPPDLLSLA